MKQKTNYFLIALVIILAASLAYSSYLLTSADSADSEATPIENRTNNANLDLTLLTAYSFPNREIISEVRPNMTFNLGEPVMVQANLTNPDNSEEEFVIIVDVRNGTHSIASSFLQSSFENSNTISLETLWRPDQIGDYKAMIFALEARQLNDPGLFSPIASVPIKVVEK